MAEFRGTVQGNRGEASGLGHKNSGLVTECNTWQFGVKCKAYYNDYHDKNEIIIYSTGGSGYNSSVEVIAIIDAEGVTICKK